MGFSVVFLPQAVVLRLFFINLHAETLKQTALWDSELIGQEKTTRQTN